MEKRYCAAPWRGLHINFEGQVKTCCSGTPHMLGDINNTRIEKILSDPVLVEIRQTIKQGKLHEKYCYNCIQSERYGSSERDWHNEVNEDFIVADADLHDYKPSIVDLRWSNVCNLTCNYCGPYCSTRWASLHKFSYNENIKPYYEQVIEFIQQNKDSVKEVALVGGEPLLMKENLSLLDVVPVDKLITLITNLNVDFELNKIVQKLLHRERVGWSMSFDNIGERFEYVRYGAKWQTMHKNVSVIANKINNFSHHGGVHAVYNLYNCTRLCELKEYACQQNINIHWQTLHTPIELDPLQHNNRVRELAVAEIYNLQKNFTLSKQESQFMQNVLEKMTNTIATDKDVGEQFKQFTYQIENVYHPQTMKFADLWPELFMLI